MGNKRAPNWKTWRVVSSVKIWEGVALSLNIEPSKARGFRIDEPDVFSFEDGSPLFIEGAEFNERIFIASRNLTQIKPTVVRHLRPHLSSVELPIFAAWAVSIGWDVPPQFAELAASHFKDARFSYWKTRELWTLVESACLLEGIEPVPLEALLRSRRTAEETYCALKDAWQIGELQTFKSLTREIGNIRVRPSECVSWARKHGIAVPAALADLIKPERADDSLGTKERTTLLLIIAALAREAKIDLSKTSKAAAQIENLTEQLGARVASRTIAEHLKLVNQAIEKRGRT